MQNAECKKQNIGANADFYLIANLENGKWQISARLRVDDIIITNKNISLLFVQVGVWIFV